MSVWHDGGSCKISLGSSSIRGPRARDWACTFWYYIDAGLIVGRFQRRADETAPKCFRCEVEVDLDDFLGRAVDQPIDQLLGGY